jgi:DNA polymerase-3 subunit delta
MVKLAARQIDGYLKTPSTPWVLIYGPDGGLVRERAIRLTTATAGDAADPFRVAELTAAMLRDDPARLSDEANAMSLTGGRRVVRLRDAGDTITGIVAALLDGPPPVALVVVEAGDLGPRSSLRLLFEKSAQGAALPCYRDEGGSLAALVDGVLRAGGLTATAEARGFLLDSLGGDRGVSRGELDKLVLYMGAPGETSGRQVTLDDALACIGDSAASSLDDVALAIGDGDIAALERAVERGISEGATPVGLLRAVARHFLRLHQGAAVLAESGDGERAVKSLRPPVHFRQADRVGRQLRRWRARGLSQAIDRLLEAEMACKRTGAPAEALTRRVFMDIAGLVAGPGPR